MTIAKLALPATCLALGAFSTWSHTLAAPDVQVEGDGTIHVPAFLLPESSYLSDETRGALKRTREGLNPFLAAIQDCPDSAGAVPSAMSAIRTCQAEAFYRTEFYHTLRRRYPVEVSSLQLGGVATEVFTPADGVPPRNLGRVLINLHGGGFQCCARIDSHVESIPIASVGQIKVISIDYRLAPEAHFPAASEDVANVYRALLRAYAARKIGIYGCSSGAELSAQSIAWFESHGLPLPGAIGMFCGGANRVPGAQSQSRAGDSVHIVSALSGVALEQATHSEDPYYSGADRANALASPGAYDSVMRRFPPSLLISGTRDMALSEVLATHAQLVRLDVAAELHVWEGLGHAFFYDPQIPESREVYDVIARFFDSHLGRERVTHTMSRN